MKRKSCLVLIALIVTACDLAVIDSSSFMQSNSWSSVSAEKTSSAHSNSIGINRYYINENQWQEAFNLANYDNLVMDLNYSKTNMQNEDFTTRETMREKVSVSENLVKMEKPGDLTEQIFTKEAFVEKNEITSGQVMTDGQFLNYLDSITADNEKNEVRQEGDYYFVSSYSTAYEPRYYGTYNKGFCYRYDFYEKTQIEQENVYRLIFRDYEEMYLYRQPIAALKELESLYDELVYDDIKHCYVLDGYAAEYITFSSDSLLAITHNKVEFYFENGVLNCVNVLLTASYEDDGEFHYDYEIVLSERGQVYFDFLYDVVDCEHSFYPARTGSKAHIHYDECSHCEHMLCYEKHTFDNGVCTVCGFRDSDIKTKYLSHLW